MARLSNSDCFCVLLFCLLLFFLLIAPASCARKKKHVCSLALVFGCCCRRRRRRLRHLSASRLCFFSPLLCLSLFLRPSRLAYKKSYHVFTSASAGDSADAQAASLVVMHTSGLHNPQCFCFVLFCCLWWGDDARSFNVVMKALFQQQFQSSPTPITRKTRCPRLGAGVRRLPGAQPGTAGTPPPDVATTLLQSVLRGTSPAGRAPQLRPAVGAPLAPLTRQGFDGPASAGAALWAGGASLGIVLPPLPGAGGAQKATLEARGNCPPACDS